MQGEQKIRPGDQFDMRTKKEVFRMIQIFLERMKEQVVLPSAAQRTQGKETYCERDDYYRVHAT